MAAVKKQKLIHPSPSQMVKLPNHSIQLKCEIPMTVTQIKHSIPKRKSEGDVNLRDELLQLVEDLHEGKTEALTSLRKHMRTSTTSMTSVPKPLKYLKDSYDTLKQLHAKSQVLADDSKRRLADVISVLAMAAASVESRECLRYCLRGTMKKPGSWGHEYVHRLEAEVVDEWSIIPRDREQSITNELLPLVKKILEYDAKHHAEIRACDVCLEIDRLPLLQNYLDGNNYSKICLYLASCANYTEDSERQDILKTVTNYYLQFDEFSRAILIAMQLPNSNLIHECFIKCKDPSVRKQLAYILARQKDRPMKKLYDGENASEIETILGNGYVNGYYLSMARELDIMEPKTPEEIYRSWLEPGHIRILEQDSARANLATTFASAFVHTGFGRDKLMCDTETHWVYNNKEHGMLSATASLGLIHTWDVDGGLSPIDKFLYATNEFVRSGALLAIGLVNCGVHNDCEPALALLSEHIMSSSQVLRIGAILGLGLAYTASHRSDLNELLCPPLNDKESSMEIIALSAISLGLVNLGSADSEITSTVLQKLLELDQEQLSSSHSRFLPLALGLLYMGHKDNIEALIAALDVLPDPYKLPAQTMIQICSYAGTGDVLIVQELIRMCSEPIEEESLSQKTSMTMQSPIPGIGVSQNAQINAQSTDGKNQSKKDKVPSEMTLTQPLATLGVAVVGLSKEQENSRILVQIGRYGTAPARMAVPLSMALSYLSNPDLTTLDLLNKYSHDSDSDVALNAIFSLGLVGAGTNNARLAVMLRQLAIFHAKNSAHLFLVRVAQGLVHLGKGTITLNPLKYSSRILDQASLAGLLVVLVSFLDCKNLILGKSHFLMYCLALAMEPRWLVTLDENLELLPVSVRIGQAVDVIGKAGHPMSITGGNVRTTPVLMSHGEQAELVTNDEYEPLVHPMEGFVILRPKI